MVMTQNQVIIKLMEYLANTEKSGSEAWDAAVKQFGYSSIHALRKSFNKVFLPYQSISKDKEREFLEAYCGIRFNNTDVGAITGSDAGNAVTKTAESIIPEASPVKTPPSYTQFSTSGLTVKFTGYHTDDADLYAKEKLIVRNLYSWWIPESMQVIKQSLGLDFSTASVKELVVSFASDDFSPAEMRISYDAGLASQLRLGINMSYFKNLSAADKNGIATNWIDKDYLDKQILGRLTEAVLAANLNGFEQLDYKFKNGLLGLVNGGDNLYNSYFSIDVSSGSVSDYWDSSIEAFAVLRYLARQASDASLPRGMTVSRDGQTLTVNSTFRGSFDTSSYSENVKTIDARKSDRRMAALKGNTKNNTIWASSIGGNYYGMKGNDTLYAGKGTDTFWYASGDGNDTIYNFGTDQDIIHLTSGAKLSSKKLAGSDALLTLNGGGSIRIKNAVGKNITLIDAQNKKSNFVLLPNGVSIDANRTNLTVKSPFTGTLDIASYTPTIRNIDASKDDNELIIKGNNYDNVIKAGQFGGEYYGRKGNDTIYGGAGEDIFWYGTGDGNDTIRNFHQDEDVIAYYKGGMTGYSSSGTDVILKTGTGSMRVAGMTNKRLEIWNEKGASSIHYFGRQDKENSFYYDKRYYYHGSVSKKDTLKIAEGATVSLANTTKYQNIDVLDASSSYAAVKLIGGKKNSTLIGSKKNDTLTAGIGGGRLQGGKGNDTLIGNTGKDIFWYGTGDGIDTIQKFQSGKDFLRYYNGTFASSFATKGTDLTLKTGAGAVKLIGMTNKRLDITNAKGANAIHYFGRQDRANTFTYAKNHHYHGSAKKADTLLVKTTATLSLGNTAFFQDIDTVDASQANAAVKLTGGSKKSKLIGSRKNDILTAGSGGAVLDGGKGNDTLYGGKGLDSFLFRKGYGADTIINSGKGDIAYLYNINNIQQAKLSVNKGVLSMKFTNSTDTLTVKNWSANGMNTVVLGNGAKYRLGLNRGKVTTTRI